MMLEGWKGRRGREKTEGRRCCTEGRIIKEESGKKVRSGGMQEVMKSTVRERDARKEDEREGRGQERVKFMLERLKKKWC